MSEKQSLKALYQRLHLQEVLMSDEISCYKADEAKRRVEQVRGFRWPDGSWHDEPPSENSHEPKSTSRS